MSHPNEAYISLPAFVKLSQDLLSLGSGDVDHTLSYQLKVLATLERHDITMYMLSYLIVDEMFDVIGENGVDYVPVMAIAALRFEGPLCLNRVLRDWMYLWNATSYDIVEDFRSMGLQGSV